MTLHSNQWLLAIPGRVEQSGFSLSWFYSLFHHLFSKQLLNIDVTRYCATWWGIKQWKRQIKSFPLWFLYSGQGDIQVNKFRNKIMSKTYIRYERNNPRQYDLECIDVGDRSYSRLDDQRRVSSLNKGHLNLDLNIYTKTFRDLKMSHSEAGENGAFSWSSSIKKDLGRRWELDPLYRWKKTLSTVKIPILSKFVYE